MSALSNLIRSGVADRVLADVRGGRAATLVVRNSTLRQAGATLDDIAEVVAGLQDICLAECSIRPRAVWWRGFWCLIVKLEP